MLTRLRIPIFCSALLAASARIPVLAANCTPIEDAEARACCERNLPKKSMRQEIRVTVADDKGTVSNLGLELNWKRFEDGRTRARVDLTEPARQAGTVVLLTERVADDDEELREPEVVLYKPGERRDRLITVSALSGEMLGTDFSYEDFAHFYGTNPDVEVTRLEDEDWQGHKVIVVQSTPKDAEAASDRGSTYARIVTRFDAEQCVPLVTQFFEQDNDLRKELTAAPEAIRQLDERWVPYRVIMYDVAEQSRTILDIDEIEFEPELKDGLFERSSLTRGR